MISYNIYISLSDLFHLVWQSLDLSMSLQMILFHSFLIMATYSSILAWKIPWTEEHGELQFMGLQKVRHDWLTEHRIFHIFFIYLFVNGYLSFFCVLDIINSAVMNIGLHVYFQIMVFLGYMTRNGFTGSYNTSIFSLTNCCTNLHPHQQRRFPFCLHPLQHLLFVNF